VTLYIYTTTTYREEVDQLPVHTNAIVPTAKRERGEREKRRKLVCCVLRNPEQYSMLDG
jgi:hypothetical protein